MKVLLDHVAGVRFQKQLCAFLKEIKPSVVCETGVATGCSAGWIVQAMEENNKGHLWGIEGFYAKTFFSHERFTFVRGLSTTGILEAFRESGPFDVFLHDSDHEIGCQTYEYNMGYALLQPGGWLMSDDIYWGSPVHNAWENFCREKGLKEIHIGCARGVQKSLKEPKVNIDVKGAQDLHLRCMKLADDACKAYGCASYTSQCASYDVTKYV